MFEATSAKAAIIKLISFNLYKNGAYHGDSLLTSSTSKTYWFKKLGYLVFLATFNDALSKSRNVKA